jgi:formylglycine-generating enzyme required for sulfatase activity
MRSLKKLFPIFCALCLNSGYSNHLDITNIEVSENENHIDVLFTLSWDYAWNNAKNHDAVWVFFKFLQPDARYVHAKVAPTGHRLMEDRSPEVILPTFETPGDQMGIFISPSKIYRGNIEWRVSVRLDPEIKSLENLEIYRAKIQVNALEMVYVPESGFYVGNSNNDTLLLRETAALYMSGSNGEHNGPYHVNSEGNTITIGNKPGNLFYQSEATNYNGDQGGSLGPGFPKGVKAFYIMKYELTQGQYVDFLNSLTTYNSHVRANFGGKNYYTLRGTVRVDKGEYFAEKPNRPANFVSWDDGLAYADWAGLRPMTELEYIKAGRGPEVYDFFEFPWGTNNKDQLSRFVDNEGDLVFRKGLDEGKLTDENRGTYGASYYWVMDLAGSLWERVITIGHPKGRSFAGTHGDGDLSYGEAIMPIGPRGITRQEAMALREEASMTIIGFMDRSIHIVRSIIENSGPGREGSEPKLTANDLSEP